ncbi:hypothetical protein Tco_0537605 [Tanacetum coccineum]
MNLSLEPQLDNIEDKIEGLGNGRVIIQQDFDNLEAELRESRTQIDRLQRNQMGYNNKIALLEGEEHTRRLIRLNRLWFKGEEVRIWTSHRPSFQRMLDEEKSKHRVCDRHKRGTYTPAQLNIRGIIEPGTPKLRPSYPSRNPDNGLVSFQRATSNPDRRVYQRGQTKSGVRLPARDRITSFHECRLGLGTT